MFVVAEVMKSSIWRMLPQLCAGNVGGQFKLSGTPVLAAPSPT